MVDLLPARPMPMFVVLGSSSSYRSLSISKEVAGFDKKSLLVVFGDLNILFVVGNYFANFIVSVIT